MQALYKMTLTQAKMFLREPAAVFFTLAFPIVVLLIFGSIFGNEPIPGSGNLRNIDFIVPAYTGLVIGTVALIGLPTTLTAYREQGILRRLRATPLHPSVVLGAQVLVHLLMTALGIALMLTTARLIFDLRLPDAPLSVVPALILGSLSFLAVGFVLAGLLPTVRVASAVGQALFLPMLFLSGAAGIPRQIFPETLQRISDFLPLTYVVELMQDLWLEGSWNALAVAVLAGILIVSVIISARTFRWE